MLLGLILTSQRINMNDFKSPKEARVTSRISSITNVFVNSLIPNLTPNLSEINKVYEILELDQHDLKCAYCKVNNCTEWDHFRPTVKNKKPTGYLAEIYNLVPACGKCNQSKRAEYWHSWIISDVKHSPKSRKVDNLTTIINNLKKFEEWSNKSVTKIDFEKCDESTLKLLDQYWEIYERIVQEMKSSQRLADLIKSRINSSEI